MGTTRKKPGRYLKPTPGRKHIKKAAPLLIALILLSLASFGGTMAYLMANSSALKNTFEPASVSCEITEDFTDGRTKSNVCVKNTGDADVYIRVKLLPYYYDKDSDVIVGKGSWTPVFTPGNGWVRGSDGYYYHTSPVSPGASTSALIPSLTLKQDDVSLAREVLEIIASCVQAYPADAVTQAWSGTNGSVTNVSGTTLTVG